MKVMFRGGDERGYGEGQVMIECINEEVMIRQGKDGCYVEERGGEEVMVR